MEQYLLSKIRRIVVRNFSNNNFSYDLRCVSYARISNRFRKYRKSILSITTDVSIALIRSPRLFEMELRREELV